MRMVLSALLAAAIGFAVVLIVSSALKFAFEAPEIRDYVPGQPVFSHPVTESYARTVTAQLNAKLNRDGIRQRFLRDNPVTGIFFLAGLMLLDPINLIVNRAGFAGGSNFQVG